jgi:TATA-binding protein-associated factor
LSFEGSSKLVVPQNSNDNTKEKVEASKSDASQARLSRRGAGLAFDQLSTKFGPRLLRVIPNMWQSMAGGLLVTFQSGTCWSFYCIYLKPFMILLRSIPE